MIVTCSPLLQTDGGGITCSSEDVVENPAEFILTPGGHQQKQRSHQGRNIPLTMDGILRSVRQTEAENVTIVSPWEMCFSASLI